MVSVFLSYNIKQTDKLSYYNSQSPRSVSRAFETENKRSRASERKRMNGSVSQRRRLNATSEWLRRKWSEWTNHTLMCEVTERWMGEEEEAGDGATMQYLSGAINDYIFLCCLNEEEVGIS